MSEQAATADEFIVYSHIGPVSQATSDVTAEGSLLLRDDLRHEAGLFAAPLCIAVLDCVSKNTARLALSAPTRIDLDVYDSAAGVSSVHIEGQVTRQGRSQMFTEATITDADDRSRVIGYASTSFAVTGPPREHGSYGPQAAGLGGPATAGAGGAPMPPLAEVFEGEPRRDGGYTIPTLSPRLGHGRLHSGGMMVLAEAAAIDLVRRHVGVLTPVTTTRLGTSLMTEGRAGPFSVVPNLLTAGARNVGVRVEVRDEGADGRFIALITVGLAIGEV